MGDVTKRMLDLLTALQRGRSFSARDLAQRLDVSERTVRRDVERLRSYGYPVETRPGPGGHYRLVAGRAMPPLVLDDDEAMAMLLALSLAAASGASSGGSMADAVDRAHVKVGTYLPARLRGRLHRMEAAVEVAPQRAPRTDIGLVMELTDAATEHLTVRMSYRRPDGDQVRRKVEPHRVFHHLLRWYLLAYDLDKGAWRTYRVDRIEELSSSTTPFVERPLPEGGAIGHLQHGLARRRTPIRVVVEAPVTDVADRMQFQNAALEAIGQERTAVSLTVNEWQWLVLNLAMLEADFSVELPEDLAADLHRFTDRLSRSIKDLGEP